MGFECVFSYHERNEDRSYNKDEIKELKRKIGEPFEDVPLEKLASSIMAQLARRDVWITDVEIFEYKKQKVNFRETKAGIVIKNKKFLLDNDTNSLVIQEVKEETTPNSHPHTALAPSNGSRRPSKWVVLDSEGITQDGQGQRIPIMLLIKKLGLQLSPDKKYPVFNEIPDPRDKRTGSLEQKMLFEMWDDHKRDISVSADYFLPAEIELYADRQIGFTKPVGKQDPKLSYEGQVNDQMPELRR